MPDAPSHTTRDAPPSHPADAGASAADAPAADAGSTAADSEGEGGPADARRLHPLTLVQQALVSLPGLLLIALPLLLASGSGSTWASLLSVLLYGLVAVPLLVLRYLRLRYWITPRELVIQSGVINRQDRSIPLERVQNVQIEQPLLPRLVGTARVKIETAGSSGTEGVLEYVALAEAQRIRRVIRTYQRRHVPAGEEMPDEAAAEGARAKGAAAGARVETDEADLTEAEPEPLFALPLRRVLLAGAFRFSLLYLALVFSVLQYVPDAEDRFIRWIERGEWQWLAEAAAASPWLAVALSVVAAALLGWLTGIALNLNRYYGFRIWLEDGKLQRRHGLLTLSQGTIPLKKVQALILRTNPLMRLFGFYRLELQTMGLDVQERGHQVAVPFAKKDEVVALAQHIRPFALPEAFRPVSRLTIRRAFVRYALLLAALVAPLAYFLWPPLWWSLLAAPLLFVPAVLRYRSLGYAMGADSFFARAGVIQHHVWVLPADKHQVFYTQATLFQRRLGLRSLSVDTAGAASFSYPEVPDLPAAEADDRLADLYARFQHGRET